MRCFLCLGPTVGSPWNVWQAQPYLLPFQICVGTLRPSSDLFQLPGLCWYPQELDACCSLFCGCTFLVKRIKCCKGSAVFCRTFELCELSVFTDVFINGVHRNKFAYSVTSLVQLLFVNCDKPTKIFVHLPNLLPPRDVASLQLNTSAQTGRYYNI